MNNAKTKTLTAGLNHGLKFKYTEIDEVKTINSVFFVRETKSYWVSDAIGNAINSKQVLPYLFPMASLTKEIEFKGERFVPIQDIPFIRMWWKDSHFEFLKSIGENEINSSPFRVVEWLIEHHFNVFNLSPEEFIEVNEDNNPYK